MARRDPRACKGTVSDREVLATYRELTAALKDHTHALIKVGELMAGSANEEIRVVRQHTSALRAHTRALNTRQHKAQSDAAPSRERRLTGRAAKDLL